MPTTKFQSTHPSWGATRPPSEYCSILFRFQSTHPSWGATGFNGIGFYRAIYFNPRTHRGVRLGTLIGVMTPVLFQSTHPSWGATGYDDWVARLQRISIHAPIVGCDQISLVLICKTFNFNPRTHRGVRHFLYLLLSC